MCLLVGLDKFTALVQHMQLFASTNMSDADSIMAGNLLGSYGIVEALNLFHKVQVAAMTDVSHDTFQVPGIACSHPLLIHACGVCDCMHCVARIPRARVASVSRRFYITVPTRCGTGCRRACKQTNCCCMVPPSRCRTPPFC